MRIYCGPGTVGAVASNRMIVGVALFLPVCLSILSAQSDSNCVAVDQAVKTRALQTVAHNMGTEPVLPMIDSEARLPGTCYWQLVITLPHKKGHGVLYISPDRRFISPALWDMNADFTKEDAKFGAELLRQAEADQVPARGPATAPVTVVVFSDFQCPFCAAFSRMENTYEKDNPGKIRLILRNSPLPMHKWAKSAARMGICVAQQNPNVIWNFSDFLFSRQKEATADNVADKVSEFLQTEPEIDREKYLECMASSYPDSRLDKDIDAASAYRVHSTPTVFINGKKHGGFATMEEFAAVIDESAHLQTAKEEGIDNDSRPHAAK